MCWKVKNLQVIDVPYNMFGLFVISCKMVGLTSLPDSLAAFFDLLELGERDFLNVLSWEFRSVVI